MIPIIYKGEDKNILITVQSEGVVMPISNISEMIVCVYQNKEEIIQFWKLSDNTLVIIDDANGIVSANLDRDNLDNIPMKRLFLEIAIEFSNASFESGLQRLITSDIVLADLKNSVAW